MDIKYETKTGKSFDEAVKSLKESLKSNGFGVLWELNFKDKLNEKGLDFSTNFKVFEVCNPKQAQEVLTKHIEAGYFLPCKMVIYEKDDSVYVGLLRPTELIGMMGKEELMSTAQNVERILIKAIDEAV